MQQHEWKTYVEFTVYEKSDKMKKNLRNLQSNRPEIFFKKDAQLVINDKTRTVFNFEKFS